MAPFLALTLQRPRDHHEGGMEITLLWAAFSLGAWPWPEGVGLGTQGRKGKRRGPLERRLVWVGEPLHHWPRWGDGSVSQRTMWGARDRGLVTPSQLLWPLRSRDRHCQGLGWFWLAMHTPGGPAHSRGTLVSAAGAMRPAPGRKA